MSSQLNATDIISVATDMTNAFIGAATRAAGAKDFEKREFAQLVEDIHRYQLEFRNGQLSQRDAQELIDDAVQDTQSTLATATAMRQDAITGAMNAAIKVLSQAIRTTLNAAFAGFAFTL